MRRVLVTGGSGFIGAALVRSLLERGDLVTVLSRNPAKARAQVPREARVAAWTPTKKGPWCAELGVVDAVVHLAGHNVAGRWSDAVKAKIKQSRVDSTRLLVEAIAEANNKPAVLVSASGTGIYGDDRPGEQLDEESSPGKGFLAEVCEGWEGAAREAEEHGVRSVQMRTGMVLGAGGGALKGMVLPMRMGVGRLGKGDNLLSWVHVDDAVGMYEWAMDDDELSGPVNLTAPGAVTADELASTIASVIGRPVLPMPAGAVRMLLGEMADAVLGNLDVYPRVAVERGYEFYFTKLMPALEDALMGDERVTLAS